MPRHSQHFIFATLWGQFDGGPFLFQHDYISVHKQRKSFVMDCSGARTSPPTLVLDLTDSG